MCRMLCRVFTYITPVPEIGQKKKYYSGTIIYKYDELCRLCTQMDVKIYSLV